MRRSQPIRLGDLWEGFVKENPEIERRLVEGRIPQAWREVAGDGIAAMTTSVRFRNGTLSVSISSPAVRQEIFMRRTAFVSEMNTLLGRKIIKSIMVG